jgi:hypothetical protein
MTKSGKSTKKRNRRNSFKYPAVEKSVNLKSRSEEIDDIKSYFHTLSPEDQDWMNRFTAEYVNADFSHDDIIHKKRKQKQECYNRNNARNRDIYTQEAAKGMLQMVERIEDLEKMDVDDWCKPLDKKKEDK